MKSVSLALITPPCDCHVKTVVAADFWICPGAPLLVSFNEGLAGFGHDEVDDHRRTTSQTRLRSVVEVVNYQGGRLNYPQVWSLTQFYSVDFLQSRIDVKKWIFNKRTIKVCVSCCWRCQTSLKTTYADLDCAFVENALFYTDPWMWRVNRIDLS